MDLRILIGGQAGQGIDLAADLLGKAFIKEGYYVFNYRYYQSLIKGGHNYNLVRVSEEKINSHEEKDIDFIIALDQNTVDLHKNKLKKDRYIITDKSIKADKKIEIDTNKIINEIGGKKIDENIVLIITLWKILGLDKETIGKVIYEKIGDIAWKYVDRIYNENLNVNLNYKVERRKFERRYYLSGNEAVALGAIAAGLDIYIAYPMTPASPVLHLLASLRDKYNILVYQPDNEIGVINIGIGASYAGAKVMVGSSGGGIDLMGEAISLSGMSEIPIVIYWVQRYGPSTGMATHTSQGDLLTSLHIGHGEFPRVVFTPGDPSESFYYTILAFYFAYKYRIPAIILSDLFLGESRSTFDSIEYPNVPIERFIDLNPLEDYKNYDERFKLRTIPGLKAIVKACSYEHDEFGIETEDPNYGQKMSERRIRKIKEIDEELDKFKRYSLYGDGDNLIVSWGSNKMPILDALKELKGWKYLHISNVYPFPKEIKDILEESKRIVIVENNLTSQLGQIIMKETGIEIDEKILKHNGEPFRPKEIVEKLK